jgi:metal-responsive CopG/Arc/MetJ family transcriptional regulator
MKVKTSITLSEDVLLAVDNLSRAQAHSRSEVIEEAIQAYLRRRTRDEIEARDLDILNRESELLNAEALDALDYQVEP